MAEMLPADARHHQRPYDTADVPSRID